MKPLTYHLWNYLDNLQIQDSKFSTGRLDKTTFREQLELEKKALSPFEWNYILNSRQQG